MDSMYREVQSGSESAVATSSPGATTLPYSRSLLRRVLTLGPFGPGARVLVVGSGFGRLAEYLDSLGLDVTGLDGSEANIESARLLNPNIEFDVGFVPREHFQAHNPNFDLIFARTMGASVDGKWSRSTMVTISALVSCLRTNGALVVEFSADRNSPLNRKTLLARFVELAKSTGPIRHEIVEAESSQHVIFRYAS